MGTLHFEVVGCRIQVDCEDEASQEAILATFDHLRVSPGISDVSYRVYRSESGEFGIARNDRPPQIPWAPDELLRMLDDDLVVALQESRPDLFFLHSAVLELNGRALLFPADSGSGKSTLAWAFTHHGFGYLSDELAPLDVQGATVFSFPRALCLKTEPPETYPLPKNVVRTGRFIHIPVKLLSEWSMDEPLPVSAIFFPNFRLRSSPEPAPKMTTAHATARIYAASLNALAHPGSGLDAAASLAASIPCYELATSDLNAAAGSIKKILSIHPSSDESHSPS